MQTTLPRRGEKDFEPNPTLLQSDILAASRDAMYTAISHPRIHPVKSMCVGIYAPEGPTPLADSGKPADDNEGSLPSSTEAKSATAQTVKNPMAGISPDACVYVTQPKGILFKTVGRADRWNRVWLLPEEAIYLVERGSLYLKWPSTITEPVQIDGKEMGIPMSLEATYACMMGHGGLTLERYVVYSGLKRAGYTVIRAPSWHGTQEEPERVETAGGISRLQSLSDCWSRFYESVTQRLEKDYSAQGPLIGLSTPRSYSMSFSILFFFFSFFFPITKYSATTNRARHSSLTRLQRLCFVNWH